MWKVEGKLSKLSEVCGELRAQEGWWAQSKPGVMDLHLELR